MNKKHIIQSIGILSLAVFLSGCISIDTGANQQTSVDVNRTQNGGIYFSSNQGGQWEERFDILTTQDENKPSLANIGVTTIDFDSQDPNAVYAGSTQNGIFISYDKAASWTQYESLNTGYISDIQVSLKNKCLIYAAQVTNILKSDDCGRSWDKIFIGEAQGLRFVDIFADPNNTGDIYAITQNGDLFLSSSDGEEWSRKYSFDVPVVKAMIAKNGKMYVGTSREGIYISDEKKEKWTQIYTEILEAGSSAELRDFDLHQKTNHIIIATEYGLLESTDDGKTWKELKLLTPPYTAIINNVRYNPEKHVELFYTTSTNFYRSNDNGVNWQIIELPTASVPKVFEIFPDNVNNFVLGFQKINK